MTNPSSPVTSGSGSQVQVLENFHHLVNQTFFPMSCVPARDYSGNFSGAVHSQQLGAVGFAAVKGSPLDVYRRQRHISEVTDAVYLVKVQVSGESLVKQCNREAHLQPGDFALCLSSEPYELHFAQHYSQVVLAVPVALMEDCVQQPERHLGVKMDAKVGANGLFTQFVTSIANRLDTLDGVIAQRLEANVIDLLSTTLGYAQETERQQQLNCGVKGEYLKRIKQFIRMHLGDERLGPDWIAQAQQISTRYLHMLFEGEQLSVSRYIQKLRLEQCHSALNSDAFAKYSVSDVGYRFGFQDASHFSRSFKAEYGQTPAQFRRNARQP